MFHYIKTLPNAKIDSYKEGNSTLMEVIDGKPLH